MRHSRGVADTLTAATRVWQTPRVQRGAYQRDNGDPNKERLTLEGEASQWRTPQAGDATRGAKSQRGQSSDYKDPAGRHSLVTEVSHWQTPATDSFRSRGGDRKDEMGLDQQARTWPTPRARDHKGSGTGTERPDGRTRMDQLDWAAEHWKSSSRPDQPIPDGQASSEEKRVLNPLFVEWLMGWPIGWTDCEPVETGLSAWLERMRSALSTLCSRPADPQDSLF